MPNHFHLFVKQITDLSIGKFVDDLTNSYTKATNIRYNRSGVLFESRTKNKHIAEQEYFIWMGRYILMNPVEAKLVERPHHWEFPSARDLFGMGNSKITDTKELPSMFDTIEDLRAYIENTDNSIKQDKLGKWD